MYFNARLKSFDYTDPILPDRGQTGIEWLPIKEIHKSRIYPLSLRKIIHDQKSEKIYFGDVN